LRDIVTGEEREVDASIRYRIGSVDLLLIVECRDRVKTEDVTWIEQLVTKQRHVGAAHAIAVSSTGFSSPAVRAAQHLGISTRTISEVTDADVLAWADKLVIEEVDTTVTLGKMELVYDGIWDGAHLNQAAERQWNESGWDALIFHNLSNGTTVSLSQLLSTAVARRSSLRSESTNVRITLPPGGEASFSDDPLALLVRGAPTDGSAMTKKIWLTFEGAQIAVDTTRGRLRVSRVGCDITTSASRRSIQPGRVVSYRNESNSVADIAETEMTLRPEGGKFVITQHKISSVEPSQ
jgi:hypothetical protein